MLLPLGVLSPKCGWRDPFHFGVGLEARNVFCLEDKKITDLVLCVQVLVTANEISVVGGSMRPPKVGSVVWLSP